MRADRVRSQLPVVSRLSRDQAFFGVRTPHAVVSGLPIVSIRGLLVKSISPVRSASVYGLIRLKGLHSAQHLRIQLQVREMGDIGCRTESSQDR